MNEYDPNYLDFEQPILELEAKIKKIHDDPEKTCLLYTSDAADDL